MHVSNTVYLHICETQCKQQMFKCICPIFRSGHDELHTVRRCGEVLSATQRGTWLAIVDQEWFNNQQKWPFSWLLIYRNNQWSIITNRTNQQNKPFLSRMDWSWLAISQLYQPWIIHDNSSPYELPTPNSAAKTGSPFNWKDFRHQRAPCGTVTLVVSSMVGCGTIEWLAWGWPEHWEKPADQPLLAAARQQLLAMFDRHRFLTSIHHSS